MNNFYQYRGVILNVRVQRVWASPFFGLQRAFMAAFSQAWRWAADVPPVALAETTLSSASIITVTGMVTGVRNSTYGEGQPMKVRPLA